jgi:hypothetical protein
LGFGWGFKDNNTLLKLFKCKREKYKHNLKKNILLRWWISRWWSWCVHSTRLGTTKETKN